MPTAAENHEAQRAYWDGAGGDKWIARSDDVDASAAPAQRAALDVAAPGPGAHVLDIGCGCGGSTLALAERVGSSGRALGLDLSQTMIAEARRRAKSHPNVDYLAADAASCPLAPAAFDLLFSRFGVMFFGDPVAAFAHVRGALKPEGKLVFVCWRPLDENDWMGVPFRAVLKHAPRPPRLGPDAPGPFSFADPQRVAHILTSAGFGAPRMEKFDFVIDIGRGRGLDAAVESALTIGPASAALTDQSDDVRDAARSQMREDLAPYGEAGAFALPAAAWIVHAAR